MTDPTGNALRRSLERIDSYALATFGVRLTLSDPGTAPRATPTRKGSRCSPGPSGARTGDGACWSRTAPRSRPLAGAVAGAR